MPVCYPCFIPGHPSRRAPLLHLLHRSLPHLHTFVEVATFAPITAFAVVAGAAGAAVGPGCEDPRHHLAGR